MFLRIIVFLLMANSSLYGMVPEQSNYEALVDCICQVRAIQERSDSAETINHGRKPLGLSFYSLLFDSIKKGHWSDIVRLISHDYIHPDLVVGANRKLGYYARLIHVAAIYNREDIVGFLLARGAHPYPVDINGRTPFSLTTSLTVRALLDEASCNYVTAGLAAGSFDPSADVPVYGHFDTSGRKYDIKQMKEQNG